MTTPTYTDFKAEQSEAERRNFLSALLATEKNANSFAKSLDARVAEDEATIAKMEEALKVRKAETAEIKANLEGFVKDVSKVADQDVITSADVNDLNAKLADAKLTKAQREQAKAATTTNIQNAEYVVGKAFPMIKNWEYFYDYYKARGYSMGQCQKYADRDFKLQQQKG